MISDAIALVEFISNQFSKVQGKKDKQLEQFVEPAYSKLQAIHEDYIKACRKYWESIRYDQPLNIMKVVNAIEQDIRFAPHESRIDLLSSIQSDEPLFQEFITSIHHYLMGQSKAVRTQMIFDIPPNRRTDMKISLLKKLDTFSKVKFQISTEEIARLRRGKIYLSQVGYHMELEPDNPLRNISNNPEEAMNSFDEYIRYLSLAYVDCLIAILQRDYAKVSDNYWALKRKLQGLS
ncbi:hypothetical protein NIES2119_32100 [[Phormidium ambiguum] IAM M-71]|uniref:Uncharacterized protein n=1 Tax=[Phormidium ambiguum] IAM M-71 TaxID=454136 RepID=A0A1U7I0Y5_9CYAN|nr:hypothetical protein [Phormidium ambiguum]OKH29593.1 hypothetical protein NIES2119_32100 [Phormidium ambiguum IAM M-71]